MKKFSETNEQSTVASGSSKLLLRMKLSPLLAELLVCGILILPLYHKRWSY